MTSASLVARLLGAVSFLCAMLAPAHAQDAYPSKPIRLIVPVAAGGGMDTVARIVSLKLGPLLGQQVIVDNRPGGAENIGIDAVAKSLPDGYTVLLSSNSITMNPSLFKRLPYNANTDLQPLGKVSSLPLLIVANASAPYKSLGELEAYAKANPGKLSYGSPGNGTPHHLAMELYKAGTGLDILHVPYKGTAPGLTDLLGNNITLLVSTVTPAQSQLQGGKLHALATMSGRRLASFKDVPAVAETHPGFNVGIWQALFVPAGTPPAVAGKLTQLLEQMCQDPAFIKQVNDVGGVVTWLPPAQLSADITSEQAQWAQAIKSAGLQAE